MAPMKIWKSTFPFWTAMPRIQPQRNVKSDLLLNLVVQWQVLERSFRRFTYPYDVKICSPTATFHQSNFLSVLCLETSRGTIIAVASDHVAFFTEAHTALPLSDRHFKSDNVQETHPLIVVVEVIDERTQDHAIVMILWSLLA